ncbi:MAG: hypothetical protein N3A54_02495 [Patescibacteria group bacterium]|nr:hypothetical protein [Patescibacteria group bacterium]
MKTVIDVYPVFKNFDLSQYKNFYMSIFFCGFKKRTPSLEVIYDPAEGVYYTFESIAKLKVLQDFNVSCYIGELKMSDRVPSNVAEDMGWNPRRTIEETYDFIIQEASKGNPYKITVENFQ